MTDFITLVVLAWVIYVYTHSSEKSFIDANGNLSLGFLFGYILGLGYPAIYTNYKTLLNKEVQESNIIKYIYLICAAAFIAFVVIMNYTSINIAEGDHRISYILYVVVIALLFGGLLLSKKNTKNYNSVTYFYSNGENCSFNKYGVVQSSGDLVKITIPFMVFIILLLFSYEPNEITMKTLYTFIYGLLLGILVSSISYYGIEYFLQKTPQKQCDDINECTLKEMPTPQIPVNNTNINIPNIPNNNINSNLNNNTPSSNMSPIKIALLIVLILVAVYLIYFAVRRFTQSQ
jgi:4-amino-4-deoxy-L-arabinose transferase-like glycosyltransferase